MSKAARISATALLLARESHERELAEELTRDRESVLQQQQIIEASPTLTARDVQLDREWEVAVTNALTEPLASRQDRRMAEIRAGAALGAVRATLRAWQAQGGRPDLVKLGAEGLELLERIFQPDRRRTATRSKQRGKR